MSRLAILVLLLLSDCGGRQVPPRDEGESKPEESAVSRFLPLVDGTVWAYDARDDETGGTGMFVTRVRRTGSRFALVTSQGSHVLETKPDGILRAEGKYVLKAPLVLGAEWPGEAGTVIRITAIDRAVTVPAGHFSGCVETIEERPSTNAGENRRRVTTTYCPYVGIAVLHAEAWESGRHAGEQAALRSFGKAVEISK